MKKVLLIAALAALALLTLQPKLTSAGGLRAPHWKLCRWNYASGKSCSRFLMPQAAGRKTYGKWTKCTPWASGWYLGWSCVHYPRFKPPAPKLQPVTATTTGRGAVLYTTSRWVTGYSWNCGVYGNTADGSPAQVGDVAVPSQYDPLWHHHIYVPALGYYGYVNDTGAPLDLLAPSCGVALTYTGEKIVEVLP